MPSNSICPNKQDICMVLTVDPFAPDCTINCKLFSGNLHINPAGRQHLFMAFVKESMVVLYERSIIYKDYCKSPQIYISTKLTQKKSIITYLSKLGIGGTPFFQHIDHFIQTGGSGDLQSFGNSFFTDLPAFLNYFLALFVSMPQS